MRTVEFYGVTVEYVEGGEFANLLAEWDAEAEEARIEWELRKYLRTLSPSDPEYSDVFKDVYGVRPCW